MAAAARSYLDFEPPHNVVEGTNKQTLVINLPGFKKEHLRVQIDHYGKLRISGERQLDQGSNKWSRFRKEFHVPEGCDPTGVRARFEKDGVLHITMPRLSPVDALPKMPKAADATTGQDQRAAAGHGAPAQPAAAEEKKRREVEAEEAAARKRRREVEEAEAATMRRREAEEAEEAARMRPGEEDEHTSEDESGRGEASAARPVYGFVRDRGGMVRRLLLAVALFLVGVAGLYARYRLTDPSAEPAPADDPAVSDY